MAKMKSRVDKHKQLFKNEKANILMGFNQRKYWSNQKATHEVWMKFFLL